MTTRVPFTPVDELGYWLDGPGEPNNVHLEVHVAGHLDTARLREAVEDTLTAHPLARARRAPLRGRQRRLEWEIPDRPETMLEPADWSTPEELARGQRHVLAAAPPLDSAPVRVQHAVGPDRDVVLLSAHHAVLDGLSCLRLLRSIVRRYAGAPDPVPANPLSVRVPRSGRDRPPRLSRRPPTRIAADRGRPLPGYGLLRLVLPCRPRTGLSAGTVNDVLIAALATAISRWNRTHDADVRALCITVPINARAPRAGRRAAGQPVPAGERHSQAGRQSTADTGGRRLADHVGEEPQRAAARPDHPGPGGAVVPGGRTGPPGASCPPTRGTAVQRHVTGVQPRQGGRAARIRCGGPGRGAVVLRTGADAARPVPRRARPAGRAAPLLPLPAGALRRRRSRAGSPNCSARPWRPSAIHASRRR